MSVIDLEPGQVTCRPDIAPDLAPMNPNGLAGPVSARRAYPPNVPAVLPGPRALHGVGCALRAEEQPNSWEQLLCAAVVGSDDELIVGVTRLDKRTSNGPCLARTRRTMS